RRVHGDAALAAAEQVSGFFFGGLAPRELTADAFAILRAEARFNQVSREDISFEGDNSKLDVVKMLVASGSAASNGAAKKLLEQGATSINKEKVGASQRAVE